MYYLWVLSLVVTANFLFQLSRGDSRGCFHGSLAVQYGQSDDCISLCFEKSYPYAGIRQTACLCGNEYAMSKRGGVCRSCPGNVVCGRQDSYAAYTTSLWEREALSFRGCWKYATKPHLAEKTFTSGYAVEKQSHCLSACKRWNNQFPWPLNLPSVFIAYSKESGCHCARTPNFLKSLTSTPNACTKCVGQEAICGGTGKGTMTVFTSRGYPEDFIGCFQYHEPDHYWPVINDTVVESGGVLACQTFCGELGYLYAVVYNTPVSVNVWKYGCRCGNGFPVTRFSTSCREMPGLDAVLVYGTEKWINAPVGYMGCWTYNKNDELQTVLDGAFSKQACIDACFFGGNPFAGFVLGGQCICGVMYGQHGPSRLPCNIKCLTKTSETCSGLDADCETCGGLQENSIEVFQTKYNKTNSGVGLLSYIEKVPARGHIDGCFEHQESTFPSAITYQTDSMTVGMCVYICYYQNLKYAAVVEYNACSCSNELTANPTVGCQDDMCGGHFFSKTFNDFCGRKSKNRMAVYKTGGPLHIDRASFTFVGCFVRGDGSLRDFWYFGYTYIKPKSGCMQHCLSLGYPYIGLQNSTSTGFRCICSNSYGRFGRPKTYDCSECLEHSGLCGSANTYAVYTTHGWKDAGYNFRGCWEGHSKPFKVKTVSSADNCVFECRKHYYNERQVLSLPGEFPNTDPAVLKPISHYFAFLGKYGYEDMCYCAESKDWWLVNRYKAKGPCSKCPDGSSFCGGSEFNTYSSYSSYDTGEKNFAYQGCYQYIQPSIYFPHDEPVSGNPNSYDPLCRWKCLDAHYLFSGLFVNSNGSPICKCGNDYPHAYFSTNCQIQCVANSICDFTHLGIHIYSTLGFDLYTMGCFQVDLNSAEVWYNAGTTSSLPCKEQCLDLHFAYAGLIKDDCYCSNSFGFHPLSSRPCHSASTVKVLRTSDYIPGEMFGTGCYPVNGQQRWDMTSVLKRKTMSHRMCVFHCYKHNFAALVEADECRCTNYANFGDPRPSKQCNRPCGGYFTWRNELDTCGGPGVINVLRIRFGQHCPPGFRRIVPHACYHFANALRNYNDSVTHCESLNSRLLSLETQFEYNALGRWIFHEHDASQVCCAWTSGYHDGTSWKWASTGKNFTYQNWAPGEPSGGIAGTPHVWFNDDFQIDDVSHDGIGYTVCEKGDTCPPGFMSLPSHGCYYYTMETMTYDEAKVYCESLNSRLLSIETLLEFESLKSWLIHEQIPNNNVWTSGYYDGEKWWWASTGEEFTFTAWAPDEPSLAGETYVMLMASQDFEWDDVFTKDTAHPMCERVAREVRSEYRGCWLFPPDVQFTEERRAVKTASECLAECRRPELLDNGQLTIGYFAIMGKKDWANICYCDLLGTGRATSAADKACPQCIDGSYCGSSNSYAVYDTGGPHEYYQGCFSLFRWHAYFQIHHKLKQTVKIDKECEEVCLQKGYYFSSIVLNDLDEYTCKCGNGFPFTRYSLSCIRCSMTTTGTCPGKNSAVVYVTRNYLASDDLLGCWKDKVPFLQGHLRGPRDIGKQPTGEHFRGMLTPQNCKKVCSEKNFGYIGLQYSAECYCGNMYGRHGIVFMPCNFECFWNSNRRCILHESLCMTCGGSAALQVHPSNEFEPGEKLGYGCHKLSSYHDLLGVVTRETMAPRMCMYHCYEKGHKYAVILSEDTCGCAVHEATFIKEVDSKLCDYLCGGSMTGRKNFHFCGGHEHASVYRLYHEPIDAVELLKEDRLLYVGVPLKFIMRAGSLRPNVKIKWQMRDGYELNLFHKDFIPTYRLPASVLSSFNISVDAFAPGVAYLGTYTYFTPGLFEVIVDAKDDGGNLLWKGSLALDILNATICSIRVAVVNTNPTKQEAENNPFKVNQMFSVTSTSRMSDCIFVISTDYKWEVYSISNKWPVPCRENKMELPRRLPTDKKYIIFPKYVLLPATYTVRLVATVTTNTTTGQGRSEGWIVVASSPVIAVIYGGTRRVVSWEEEFTLNASMSYDPDVNPLSDKRYLGFTFKWYCYIGIGEMPSDDAPGCPGQQQVFMNNLQQNDSVIYMSGNNFTALERYTFVVEVKKGVRAKRYTQVIEVLAGQRPTLDIKCLLNCGMKMNPSEAMSFQVECISCNYSDASLVESLNYIWAIEPLDIENKDLIVDPHDTSVSVNTDTFVIKPDALKQGYTYFVTVKGGPGGDACGIAYFQFTVNEAPRTNTCTLSRSEGVSFKDEFTINCESYIDGDTPLTYEFYYRTLEKPGNDISDAILLYFTDIKSSLPATKLPPGNIDRNYEADIIVRVLDIYKTSTSRTFTVRVTPAEEPLEALRKFAVTRDPKKPCELDQLVAAGNANGIINFAATAVNTLNAPRSVPETAEEETKKQEEDKIRTEVRSALIKALEQLPVHGFASMKQLAGLLNQASLIFEELTYEAKISLIDALLKIAMFMSDLTEFADLSVLQDTMRFLVAGAAKAYEPLVKDYRIELLGLETNESLTIKENTDIAVIRNQAEVLVEKLYNLTVIISSAVFHHMFDQDKPLEAETEFITMHFERQSLLHLGGTRIDLKRIGYFIMPSLSSLLLLGSEVTDIINVTVLSVAANPVVWGNSFYQANTRVAKVLFQDIANKSKEETIQLVQPFEYILNISGSNVSQVDSYFLISPFKPSDRDITVHKFTMDAERNTSLTFDNLPPDVTLKVIFKWKDRPVLEDFAEKINLFRIPVSRSEGVTSDIPLHSINLYNDRTTTSDLYIGIMFESYGDELCGKPTKRCREKTETCQLSGNNNTCQTMDQCMSGQQCYDGWVEHCVQISTKCEKAMTKCSKAAVLKCGTFDDCCRSSCNATANPPECESHCDEMQKNCTMAANGTCVSVETCIQNSDGACVETVKNYRLNEYCLSFYYNCSQQLETACKSTLRNCKKSCSNNLCKPVCDTALLDECLQMCQSDASKCKSPVVKRCREEAVEADSICKEVLETKTPEIATNEQKKPSDLGEIVDYHVATYTANQPDSETSAKVSVILHGYQDSGELNLDITKFARGSTDTFEFKIASIGMVSAVSIWHDNSGGGADWLLDKVAVYKGYLQFTCPCRTWLRGSVNENLQKIPCFLSANTTPTEPPQIKRVNFTLYFTQFQCIYWNESGAWSDKGCLVGPYRSAHQLHCQCSHMTLFGGFVYDMPNQLLPPLAKLVRGFFANGLVLLVVLVTWMIFFVLTPYLSRMDEEDVLQSSMVILGDNSPLDTGAYVITAYTGQKIGSGTTSRVTVILKGSKGSSFPTILYSKERITMQRGGKDLFLMTTAYPLGDLTACEIWHDNRGESPSWFLSELIVRDIVANETWFFVYNNWLGADKGPRTYYFELTPVSEEELRQFRNLFVSYFRKHMSDSNLWTGLLWKPPESTFTRVERLACAVCLLTHAMFFNIFFHGWPSTDPADQFKVDKIRLTPTTVIIGIISGAISIVTSFIIVLLFRLSENRPFFSTWKMKGIVKVSRIVQNMRKGKREMPLPLFTDESEWLTWIKESRKDENTYLKQMTKQMKEVQAAVRKLTRQFKPSDRQKFLKSFLQDKKAKKPARGKRDATSVAEAEGDGEEEAEQVKQFKLPWWCTNIAWTLMICSSLTASVLTIIIGIRYSYSRSFIWLFSLVASFLLSFLVFEPLKVLILTIIASAYIKKPIELEDQPTDIQVKDEQGLTAFSEKEGRRNTWCRHKPTQEEIDKAREIADAIQRKQDLLKDIILLTSYTLALVFLLFVVFDPRCFQISQMVEAVLLHSHTYTKFIEIEDVKTMWHYIEYTLVPSLYLTNLYNGKVAPPGFTDDFVSRRVGVVRLRQLRMQPGKCEVVAQTKNIDSFCVGAYSWLDEETRSYKPGWRPRKYPAFPPDEWTYQSTTDLLTLPYVGQFAVYSGGGYVQELSSNLTGNFALIGKLINSRWIDDHTSAIMVEFTLFNSNSNLFTIVFLVIEFSVTGGLFPSHDIFTVHLDRYSERIDWLDIISKCIYFIFIVIFTYRVYVNLSKKRVSYFVHFVDWVDLVILTLSLAAISVMGRKAFIVGTLLDKYAESGDSQFVNFYEAVLWDSALKYILAIQFFIINLDLIQKLSCHKYTSKYLLAFAMSLIELLNFIILMSLGVFIFAMLGQLMFGNILRDFHYFALAVETVLNMILKNAQFEIFEETRHGTAWDSIGYVFFGVFIACFFLLTLNMFRAIIITTYHSAVRSDSDKYDVFTKAKSKDLRRLTIAGDEDEAEDE